MYALIVACAVAVIVPLLLRGSVRSMPSIVVVGSAAALIAWEVAAGWFHQRPVHFRGVSSVIPLMFAGLVAGASGAALASLLGRLLRLRRAGDEALPPARRWGVRLAAAALVLLAGPYVAVAAFGMAPLATIDPIAAVVLACLVLAFLVAVRWRLRDPAAAIACAVACLALLPALKGPARMMGQEVTTVGAWPLAVIAIGMLAVALVDLRSVLRDGGSASSRQAARLALVLGLPVLVLAGTVAGLIAWSPSMRAAMHPSPRLAFQDYAQRRYAAERSRMDPAADALRHVLVQRIEASPAWYAAALPGLLADADPAIRLVAVESMRWSPRPAPWPAGLQGRLLVDPEPRISARVLAYALDDRGAVPADDLLLPALRSAYAVDQYISASDWSAWLGAERAVRLQAELVVSSDGPVRDRAIADACRSTAFADMVLTTILADPDPDRRVRCLPLLRRMDRGQALGLLAVKALVAMLAHPSDAAYEVASELLRLPSAAPLSSDDRWRAALLLLDARRQDLMNPWDTLRQFGYPLLEPAVLAGLAADDLRLADGCLRYLWRHAEDGGYRRRRAADGLMHALQPHLAGTDAGRRLRSALVAAKILESDAGARARAEAWTASQSDSAVRLVASAILTQDRALGHRVVREIKVLLWADSAALRGETIRTIEAAAGDAEAAIRQMQASSEELLRNAAARLRR
jgi:hypothetical protein